MQSQLLPLTPSEYAFSMEPAFRDALNMIAVLYDVSASSADLPLLDGDVNNDILRAILNGLGKCINYVGLPIYYNSIKTSNTNFSIINKSIQLGFKPL